MEQLGQFVSSSQNISINFNLAENTSDILHKIEIKPEFFQKNSNTEEIIVQKIHSENGIPYILVNTNLCERPIKLYIDTGAAVSIIANNVIENDTIKENEALNLFGINDTETPFVTQGIVHSTFSMGNTFLKTKLHIVDRKFVGPGDGFLGFDFLAPYKVNIDLNEMFITINLKELMIANENDNQSEIDKLNTKPQKENLNDEIEENFMNILAQFYYFEPESNENVKKNSRNQISSRTFSENVSDQNKTFDKIDQKESQEFTLNTCHLNNSHIQPLPISNIINMEQYQSSLVCNEFSQESNENCDDLECKSLPSPSSTSIKKYNFNTNFEFQAPFFNKIVKNCDLNTTNIHHFKDYG